MSKQKFADIKWKGAAIYSSNDISSMGESRKIYSAFIKNGTIYNFGDYAIFNTDYSDPMSQKICKLKSLFEENNEYKAEVSIYERANEFRKHFLSISLVYDECNEVVLNEKRENEVIDLRLISRKCRVIHTDKSADERIDSSNLDRKIYFICRYKFTINEDFVPHDYTEIQVVNGKKTTPLKTPSRKMISASRSIGVKKTYLEPIENDITKSDSPHLSQVRRNLNNSFNDSQDETSYLNYSIVEQDEKNLKIKLRVSNGKVLSKIPSLQPVVLLNDGTTVKQHNAIYELKSPSFRSIMKKTVHTNVKSNENNIHTSTPDKDVSKMIDEIKIKENTPIKLTPRKLRRLERPLYNENYSDTDSDVDNSPVGVRRSTRVRKSSLHHDFNYWMEKYCIERSNKAIRKRKLEKQQSITPLKNVDFDADSDKASKKSRRTTNDTLSTPSTKSIKKIETLKNTKSTPKTPKALKGTPLRMIRNGILTPTVDQRVKVVEKCATPLIQARNTLHVSYVPKLLPCREKEYRDIYSFIDGKLRDKCGGCMYISGVPGTGKTATVTAAIENITKTWKNEGYAHFNYVSINGMKLTEPRQCYVEILKQLTGKRVPWEQALTMLEKQFTTKSAKKVVPTVLLIDELDILCTKRQDVVYNLLDWPTKTNAQLIVLTIANTMDLPERLLMSRVTSRLGLTRLTFQAYTHKQLQEIVINRLSGNESFKADAIQFVARKVASVSGDARRALDICRRSAEIAELEGPNTQVSMQHVNAALDAMITQPKVKAILHCSKLEKLLLRAVIAEVERTGLEETMFEDVCTTLNTLATLEGFKMVGLSLVTAAVYKLTSCRLLLSDQNCNGLDQRILLNVSSDDVYFALKKD